jgi:hypothetical protein
VIALSVRWLLAIALPLEIAVSVRPLLVDQQWGHRNGDHPPDGRHRPRN